MDDKRFYSLDAMRGIAALAVVISHIGTVMPPSILHYSYLSVDFFFMLSGFVLTRAYERKLGSSLSSWRFMELRLIRLYPMFAAGILLGMLQLVGQIAAHSPTAPHPAQIMVGLAMNTLVLPDILSSGILFPFDPPAWTLFFELAINALFAVALFRMRSQLLAMICAGAGALYLLGHFEFGTGNIGWGWPTIEFGLLRVCFAFPFGILMARTLGSGAKRRSPFALLLVGAFSAMLLIGPPARFDWVYDAAANFLLLPAILWFGTVYQPPKQLEKLATMLGDASYPLFAIHFPLLRIVFYVFARQLHLPPVAVLAVFVPSCFWFAWYLFHHLDLPVRRWLSARSKLRPAAMPAIS